MVEDVIYSSDIMNANKLYIERLFFSATRVFRVRVRFKVMHASTVK